jgi:hypothetical protein
MNLRHLLLWSTLLAGCAASSEAQEPAGANASELGTSPWVDEPQDFTGMLGTYVSTSTSPNALRSLVILGTDGKQGVLGSYQVTRCALCVPEFGSFRAGFALVTIGSFLQLTPVGAQPSDDGIYPILAIQRAPGGEVTALRLEHYDQTGATSEPFEMFRLGL